MNLLEFKNMMLEFKSYGVSYYEECDYEITYKIGDVKIKYQYNTNEISLGYDIEKGVSYTNGSLIVTQSYDFLFKSKDLTVNDIKNGISSMLETVEQNKIKLDI